MTDSVVMLDPEGDALAHSLTLLGFEVIRVESPAQAPAAVDAVVVGADVDASDVDALAALTPRGVFRAPASHPLTGFRAYWLRGAPPRVLGFSGSARSGSFNRKLLRVAADHVQRAGMPVTVLELDERPLPLYHGDLEVEGALPDDVRALQRVFFRHCGLLVAAPEYNGFPTPLLINTLAWLSRSTGGASGGSTFAGTVAGIVSAAGPGAGARARPLVRQLLTNLRMRVVEPEVGIARGFAAFDDAGALRDEAHVTAVAEVANALVAGIHEDFVLSE